MRISGIIDKFAAIVCELAHTRTITRGIYRASDGEPTTRLGRRNTLRLESHYGPNAGLSRELVVTAKILASAELSTASCRHAVWTGTVALRYRSLPACLF